MLNELEGENDGLWWPAMQWKVLAAAVCGLSVGPCVKRKKGADLRRRKVHVLCVQEIIKAGCWGQAEKKNLMEY